VERSESVIRVDRSLDGLGGSKCRDDSGQCLTVV